MDASVERVGRSLSSLGRRGASAVQDIGASANTTATSVERATARQARSIQTLTAEIQSGGRATREFQETLARNRGGEQAVAQLRPYLDELDRVRVAQQAAAQAALRGGSAFNTQSQSAAQLAANLRVVPAQLTDIVTSLQGGQAPLTVFLQQGGQLRDMFGSIGGAARALGGYLVSLISPLTVGAAAVALLAVAYNEGSKEADAFRKSITLTGNAAGVTTSQLTDMSKEAAKVAGTQGANADALAKLVGTGRVGADQLVKASTSALQAQKYLGLAVEDTVKNFAELGKAPLQASVKLNEEMNYLTETTYQQIKALELQGRTADAAKVAQTAYADALSQRSKGLEGSLGSLQKSWNFVGESAKFAWDKMLDIGREDTLDEKIKKAEAALKKANLARYSSIGTQSERDGDRDEAQRQVDRLKNIKKVQQVQAESDAADVKRFTAARANEAEEEKYLTRREQQERAIAKARQVVTDAAPRGQDAAVTEEAIQKRIAQIRASYADLNNQGIESQIAAVERLGAKQEEVAKRALIALQGDQDAGLNKALDKQFEYIDAIAAADEAALTREKARLQQRLKLTAQEAVSEDGRAAQKVKLADLSAQIELKDEQIATRRAQRDKDIFVADKKNSDAIAESYNALFDSRKADTDALDAQLKAQQEQNAALGLSGKALDDLNTKLVEEKAARLEAKAATIEGNEARKDEAIELRKQAQLIRDLNKAQIEGANKTKAIEANKSFWESVDKTAQAAFTAIFEGGKSVSDRLKDAFKAGILDVLYQLTVKKWIIQLSTSAEGSSIGSQLGALAGGTSGGGTGFIGTATNLFSAGKMIYNGFSAGIASSLGTQITSLGNLFGSQAVSAFGTGMGLTTAQAGTAAAAYGGTGTAVGGGLTAGASAASAIPIIGWIIAGMMANDGFYKQGYRIDGQRGDITKELLQSTLKGNFLGPIGASATVGIGAGDSLLRKLGLDSRTASLLSGSSLWAKAFGRQSPTIQAQGIQGTISSAGVTGGESFVDVLEKGGWFRSDKRYTNTAALDADTDGKFDTQVTSIISAVKGFGTALGEQTTQIDGYTKQFKLTLTGNAEEDNKAVAALFGGIGDDLATLLIPSISKLSAEGETAGATLARVAQDYTVMNAALGAIGLSFGAVGAASLESREALIALTGGLDTFVSQAEFFSENFLSQAERTAAVQKQLDTAFADLGIKTIPKTRDEFAALVKGLDLTSASGQKTYAGLMNLEQAFAAITPQIDAAVILQQQRSLDIQLMQALGNEEAALASTRADALASLLTDQARITQAQIYAAQDAKKVYDSLVGAAESTLTGLANSINAEKDRINAAYTSQAAVIHKAADAAVKSAQDSLTAANTQVQALQTVFNALDGALSSTKIESEAATLARRQGAQSVFAQALANPNGIADNKALTDAIGTITSQSNTRLFGTFEDYARDQARTNNAIAALRDSAGKQIDYAELQVQRLEDTIEAIQQSSDAQLVQLQIDTQAQLDKLDKTLELEQAQLDALKGISSTNLSVEDALRAVADALGKLGATPTAIGNTSDSAIENLYTSLLGRASDAEGLEFYKQALRNGKTIEEIAGYIKASDEYKNLGGQPANVIPSIAMEQVSALMTKVSDPAANSAALADVVKQQAVAMANMQAALDRIATSSATSADVLDSAQKGGQPLRTAEA
jgi:phage-related minor tail protein